MISLRQSFHKQQQDAAYPSILFLFSPGYRTICPLTHWFFLVDSSVGNQDVGTTWTGVVLVPYCDPSSSVYRTVWCYVRPESCLRPSIFSVRTCVGSPEWWTCSPLPCCLNLPLISYGNPDCLWLLIEGSRGSHWRNYGFLLLVDSLSA